MLARASKRPAGPAVQNGELFDRARQATNQTPEFHQGAAGYAHPTITIKNYDLLNRVTGIIDAAGQPEQRSTSYVYDAVGNLVTKVTGLGSGSYAHPSTMIYSYDALNRRTAMTEAFGQPEQRSATYSYDLGDNLVTQVTGQAAGSYAHVSTATYGYDALSRVTTMIEADAPCAWSG